MNGACESLESRRLFSTVTWITQASGDWSVGSNWNTGTVPAAGDKVVIDIPGVNIVVTYSGAAVLPLNDLVNNEKLVLAGSGGETWTGGTWDGSGIVENDSTLLISGSTDKILKDGITYNNAPGAATTVSGTGNIVGQVGATINNLTNPFVGPGIFTVTSDMKITFPTGIGDGNFNNFGTFIKSAGATTAGALTEIGGAQGFTFNNDGDCQVQQGTLGLGDNANPSLSHGTFEISAGATLVYLRGTEDLVYTPTGSNPPYIFPSITGLGTLLIQGGNVQHFGNFDVQNLNISSGSLLLQQNMTYGNTGAQLITSLTTPSATSGNVKNFLLTGGTFGGNGGGIFGVGVPNGFNQVDQSSGQVVPPITTTNQLPSFSLPTAGNYELPGLVVSDTFSWTGGTFSGSGRTVLDTSIVNPTITTTNPKTIAGGYCLDLLLPVTWRDSGTIAINGGSAIWIEPSGELLETGNGTITGLNTSTGLTDAGNIINSGNFLKLGGVATTEIGAGINFYNDVSSTGLTGIPKVLYKVPTATLVAQVDTKSGTLQFDGSLINTDDVTIGNGTALTFNSGNQINGTNFDLNVPGKILGEIVNGVATGTIFFGDGATFTGDSRARLDVGTTFFGAGTYDFNNLAGGAQVVHTGTFSGGSAGSIGGNGTLEIAKVLTWNSGVFSGTGGVTSSLLIDSTAQLILATGNHITANGYSVDNRGAIGWANASAGKLIVGGNYNQSATGSFSSRVTQGAPNSMIVSGTVGLAGTLNLSSDSFQSPNATVLTIIDHNGTIPIVGSFSNIIEGQLFTLGANTLSPTYIGGDGNDLTFTSVIYSSVSIATPGPFLRTLSGNSSVLVFTVSLNAATNVPVTVAYATSNGTAKAGTDYAASPLHGTLTIPAGQTTGSIGVTVFGTSAVVAAETFTLTLSNPTNAILGTSTSAVATIVAPNGPPALSFKASTFSVDENAGLASIVVTSSNPSLASSVQYSTSDGSAIAGVDYTNSSGILTFAVGVSQQTFTIPIIDLGLTTGLSKQFTLTLFSPQGSGATLGVSTATVFIVENDGIKPTLSISDTTITEPLSGQIMAVFNVTLSAPTSADASVQYTTLDGTAIEGKYVAQSGTVVFPVGSTTAQISIPVNSDFVQHATETFSVLLSNPVEVTIGDGVAVGSILSQTLTTVSIIAGRPFRYHDAANQRASISLSGPGTGTVTYLGATEQDAKQIVLKNTTADTVLSISTSRGLTGITNIFVNGSLKAINAGAAIVTGSVEITGGLKTLKLNSLLGGSSVSVGSGAGITSLATSLGTVTDSTFSSALPLTTFKVATWQNLNGGAGITAPSARVIASARNFDANITLTGDLGSFVVGGSLADSSIVVGGSITNVVAKTMSNTQIFAGVTAGVTTLPTLTSQFTNSVSTIKKLSVTSGKVGAFSNSLIAAPIVGNVQLSKVTVSNAGTIFGVSGVTVASVKGKGTSPLKLTNASLITSPFSDFDLRIEHTV